MPFTPTHWIVVPGKDPLAVMERTDSLGFRSFLSASEFFCHQVSEWYLDPRGQLMRAGVLAPAGTVLTRCASYL